LCRVLDAMILIRLHRAGLAERAIQLGARICVVDYVAEQELIEPDGKQLRHRGLHVQTLSPESLEVAQTWLRQRPVLSLADVFSAALARQNGWALATHDGELRALCQREAIPICGVADIVLTMAESGLLCAEDITRFKTAMRRSGYSGYKRRTIKQAEKAVRSRESRDTGRPRAGG